MFIILDLFKSNIGKTKTNNMYTNTKHLKTSATYQQGHNINTNCHCINEITITYQIIKLSLYQ